MFARPPFANPPDMFASSGMLGDRFRPSDKHFRDVFVVLTRTSFDVSSQHGNREAKRGSKIASNVWRTESLQLSAPNTDDWRKSKRALAVCFDK